MKKVSKVLGLCTLLTLATVSCKKNTEPVGFSFKADINEPTSEGKNYLGTDNIIRWNAGDQVRVFVRNGNSAVFETQDEGQKVATFHGTIEEGDEYVAFYPAQNCTDNQNGKVTMTLSEVQHYVNYGFADDTYPMAAVFSGPSANTSFQTRFYSPCGMLCLQLDGNAKIGKIELEDNFKTTWMGMEIGHPLAGDLTATVAGFDPHNPDFDLPKPKDMRKTKITLDCGEEGVQLTSTVKRFYFVLPTYPKDKLLNPIAQCQVFERGFTAKVYDTNGVCIKELSTIKDNHIKPEVVKLMPKMTINVN